MKQKDEHEARKGKIQDLEAQLEYTHTHYQKLLEQLEGAALLADVEHVAHTHLPAQHEAAISAEPQAKPMSSQAIAAGPPLASATMEKYHSIIHTPSMPFANYQLNQERHLLLLQSQLDGHKLRADEFEKVSESLAAELESVKERHSAAGHRQFQAVRKLDAEVARLKAAAAVADQIAMIHSEETKVGHDKEVAAMKLASDLLQQQLAQMAQSVPAMLRAKSDQVVQHQEAAMAVEDRIQAAVEQQVASACAGHSQELDAVCQQLQQTLDRRMQEAQTSTSAHAADKAAQDSHMSALQEEVGQQYIYIERLESLLGSMQRQHCSSQMRADLQLLHLNKPLPGEGQRVKALKARSAVAARCQQGFQGSDATVGPAATSPRPFTAPVGSLHRLATLPHLLSQPSEMPASWNTPPTPSQPQPALVVEETAVVPGAAQQEVALQELRTHQVEQQHHIQSLQADVARYKAAMQEAQVKSRSLAVAMQSLRRKHDQQWQWPPQHASQTLLKSALKQQSPDSPSRQAVDRLQPMTASSILQTKLGAPASILPRPGSALSRSVGSVRIGGQHAGRRPATARARELEAVNDLMC